MLGEFRQSIKSESKFLTEQISRRIARLTTSFLLPVWWLLWICWPNVGNTDANSGSRLGSVVFCLFSKIPNQRNIFANTQVLGVLTSDRPLADLTALHEMQTSNPQPRKGSKRKPSDLTTEEVSNVVSLLKNLVVDLDEEDEDGQIIIENVQNVIRRLPQGAVKLVFQIHCRIGHWWLFFEASLLLFSDLAINSLVNAQVKLRLLKWKAMGKEGSIELGNKVSWACDHGGDDEKPEKYF